MRLADLDGIHARGDSRTWVENFRRPPPVPPNAVARGWRHLTEPPGRHRRPTDAALLPVVGAGARADRVVFMASVLTAMRFAIHGRQTHVPKCSGMTPQEEPKKRWSRAASVRTGPIASTAPKVPAGRIVSQVPPPGEQVRRGWRVRVAESMGPQRVVIPNLIGGSERAAEINIRRRGLEMGVMATQPSGCDARSDRGAESAGQRDQRVRPEDQCSGCGG